MQDQSLFKPVKQEQPSLIQVNFKTLTQQTYSLSIAPRASVAAVKSHLSSVIGLAEGSFWLMFDKQDLGDDNMIEDYGVEDGSVVHVVLRVSQVKAVSVKMLSGKEIKMQFNEEMRVGSLKEHLQKVSNIVVAHQRLICDGRELQDDERILDLCGDGCDELVTFLVSRPGLAQDKPHPQKVKVENGVFPLVADGESLPALPDPSELNSEDVGSLFSNSPRSHSFSNASTRSSSPAMSVSAIPEELDWRKVTDRVKRRQLRNRLAAERSRNRKANYVQDLELRLSMALSNNERMERTVSELSNQVAQLQAVVQAQQAQIEEKGMMRVDGVASWASQAIVPNVDVTGSSSMGSVSAA